VKKVKMAWLEIGIGGGSGGLVGKVLSEEEKRREEM
jgi:hypothetical protein